MGRRTKEELKASNYYEWLEVCNGLRLSKKAGNKLTPAEKDVLKTIPTPETPYIIASIRLEESVPVKKKKPVMKKIDFDKNVVWPEKAQSFLCAVFNVPYTDEQCMLFCERDDCPFHGVGYFRSHGVKF
jgi:hypothetical protein